MTPHPGHISANSMYTEKQLRTHGIGSEALLQLCQRGLTPVMIGKRCWYVGAEIIEVAKLKRGKVRCETREGQPCET